RLLELGLQRESALAVSESLRLGANPHVDSKQFAFLLREHVSANDVRTWLDDEHSRDHALALLIALPLDARSSRHELSKIVRSSKGETYALALRAWLGPATLDERDAELATEYAGAASTEARLAILEVADFYRRPTLDSSLLRAVENDASADPSVRARATEL